MRTGIVVVVALLGFGLPNAHAQEEADDEYTAAIRQAVSEFDAGNWEAARTHFERAHEQQPSARTLRGIGMCAFELQDHRNAIELLTRSLVDERRPLTETQQEAVRGLVERAWGFLGRFTVTVEPPAARLRVDGAPAGSGQADRAEIVLEPGAHIFEAELEGFVGERREVEVRGGEQLELTLILRQVGDDSVDAGVPIEPLAVVVVAGALFVVDVGFLGWAIDREVELGACAGCGNMAAIASERDAALTMSVIFGAASIGMAIGGALWWIDETSSRDAEAASVRCVLAGSTAACAGRF